MRHHKRHGMKLGTDASHTKAMKRSLVCALLENDRIKTTLPKAKAIRRDVDRIITFAKKGTLHARRLAIAQINNQELVRETFEKAEQGMWQDRNGGYTRIMKLGKRKGDNAEIAIIELVQEAVKGGAPAKKESGTKVEKVEKATAKKTEAKKEAPKKETKPEAKKTEKKPTAKTSEPKAEDAPKKEEASAKKPEAKKATEDKEAK